MDSIIKVLIYLFILSMISEKLISLIRKYPRQTQLGLLVISVYMFVVSLISLISSFINDALWASRISLLMIAGISFLFILYLVNLRALRRGKGRTVKNLPNPFQNIEKKGRVANVTRTEKEITLLSVVVGFFVAFISNASLFHLINIDPEHYEPFALGEVFSKWYLLDINVSFDATAFVGLLVTGFFLSFGSKFFHDLLELVFQIKNQRKKLASPGTFDVDSIEDLEANLEVAHDDIVEIVYAREKGKIFNTKGVNGISISRVPWNKVIVKGIKISTTSPGSISLEQFRYQMPGGGYYQVPVKVVESDLADACYSVSPSGTVKNQDSTKTGTLCFPCIDGNKMIFFLTCYHVVKHEFHSWTRFRTNGFEKVVNGEGEPLGKITDVCFNDTIDAALVEKDNKIDPLDILSSIGGTRIETIRDLSSNDVNSISVEFQGASTPSGKSGIISGIHGTQKIRFDKDHIRTLSNLIELQDRKGKSLVKRGDSGSLVYTKNGEAIGMVVATDNKESYAIPLRTITTEFGVELFHAS